MIVYYYGCTWFIEKISDGKIYLRSTSKNFTTTVLEENANDIHRTLLKS